MQNGKHNCKHETKTSRRKKGYTNVQNCAATDNTSKQRSKKEPNNTSSTPDSYDVGMGWICYLSHIRHNHKPLHTTIDPLDIPSNSEMGRTVSALTPRCDISIHKSQPPSNRTKTPCGIVPDGGGVCITASSTTGKDLARYSRACISLYRYITARTMMEPYIPAWMWNYYYRRGWPS